MAHRNLQQFGLLVWKNFVLQKRRILTTCLEISFPLIFCIILIFLRSIIKPEAHKLPSTWKSFTANHFVRNLRPSPLQSGWQLYYTPSTIYTDAIMHSVQNQLGKKDIKSITAFANETEMVDNISAKETGIFCDVIGGVVFETMLPVNSSITSDIEYKIRLSATGRYFNYTHGDGVSETQWYTDRMFPVYEMTGPRAETDYDGGTPGYSREGFLALQQSINWAILEHLFPNSSAHDLFEIHFKRYPYPPYNGDKYVLILQQQFPMFVMLSLIMVTLIIVKDVVQEKEKRLREAMLLMGLSNWLHWLAWFVKYFLLILLTLSIMVGLYSADVRSYGKILCHTDPSVMFVFLVLYAIATINFAFAVTVFCNKANSAAAAGGIFFFLSYTPYFFLQPRYDSLSLGAKIIPSFFSNVAMAFGAQVIGMYEGLGSGLQWDNIASPVNADDNFSMLHVFIMLISDAVLYGLITWYADAVFPGEYGVPQPYLFFLKKSYWYSTSAPTMNVDDDDDDEELLDPDQVNVNGDRVTISGQWFEDEPYKLTKGITIKRLRKVFGKGENRKVAVNNMTLNMYQGQITVLLGHNGAGKTTTMSMLTGFLPTSGGTALVNGSDIRNDIIGVRQSLGLCPQHNILFDLLTVREHLYFFAKLKNPSCKTVDVEAEIERLLEATKLTSKADTLSRALSGGMKRKLSVAIALIGGSKVVILDEPTSGMDPDARRHTWALLQQERLGRTILLTTHFMDEADLLGDRIAIMAEGVVQCCGTSMFLKKKYGAGYHMVMVKEPECDTTSITELVQSHVPNAELESNIAAELSYILPEESLSSFESLFSQLDENKSDLGIQSYGISVTTMEEVFLRVGEHNDDSLKEKLQLSLSCRSGEVIQPPLFNINLRRVTGAALWAQRMRAMFVKRIIHTWRNRILTTAQLMVPVVFTLLALIILHTLPNPADAPPRSMTAKSLRTNTILYKCNQSSQLAQELSKQYVQQFEGINPDLIVKRTDNLTSTLLKKAEESISKYSHHYLIDTDIKPLTTAQHQVAYLTSRDTLGDEQFDQSLDLKHVYANSMDQSANIEHVSANNMDHSADIAHVYANNMDQSADIAHVYANNMDQSADIEHGYANNMDQSADIEHVYANNMDQSADIEHVYANNMDQSADIEHVYANNMDQSADREHVYANNMDQSADIEHVYANNMDQSAGMKHVYASHIDQSTESAAERLHITAGFNNQAYHSPSISVAAVFNAILSYVSTQSNGSAMTITTTNHPLPRTANDLIVGASSKDIRGFVVAINVCIGMSFLAGSFALFVVRERVVRAKHSQFVSGASVGQYWTATFTWDLFNYIMPCLVMCILFAAFNFDAYSGDHRLGIVLLLLLLYGWACIPLMYNLSFMFTVPSSAFVWLSLINLLSGLVAMLVVDILQLPGISHLHTAKILKWIFISVLPNSCLGFGLQDMYVNNLYLQLCTTDTMRKACELFPEVINPCCADHCGDKCADYQYNYLSWHGTGIGRHAVFLFIQGIFYYLLLLTMESGWLRALWYTISNVRWCGWCRPARAPEANSQASSLHSLIQEDEDVAMEHNRIRECPLNVLLESNAMIIQSLTKQYGDFTAVDTLSIGIPRGHCFGLLGTNGAGKTSTFKMLTGDETVTAGNAYIDGYDIRNNMRSAQQRLGYCPQFDALIDEMTGRETLFMFARLRGVCETLIPGVVDEMSRVLLLEDHIDKQACTYSGGNKRKLSTGIALIGDPAVIFLDEPTSGMDPVARRLLWDTLSRIRASGRTLVLTSHSMEECEALCTKLAIMVNGGLKCLGSIQHLKGKFGEGYTLLVKARSEADIHQIVHHIENQFPTATLKDAHHCMLHFHISDDIQSVICQAPLDPEDKPNLRLLFSVMQKAQRDLPIEDYSISQTTLEQVFVNFARSQVEPQPEEHHSCCYYICCCCCKNSDDGDNNVDSLTDNNTSIQVDDDTDDTDDTNPLV